MWRKTVPKGLALQADIGVVVGLVGRRQAANDLCVDGGLRRRADLFGNEHLDEPAAARIRAVPTHIVGDAVQQRRSEEHTSELQTLMRLSYAVFCLNKQTHY